MKSSWNVSAARPDASHTATAASSSNLVAAGNDRLGHTTDQRGRLDRLLHRVEDLRSLLGV